MSSSETKITALPTRLQRFTIEGEDGKKEAAEQDPMIVNMQHAIYQIKIADIENRVKRLTERNDDLSDEIEDTQELTAEKDAETAEQVEDLRKRVSIETRERDNLKTAIETIQNDRKLDLESSEQNSQLSQEKYQKTRKNLTSEIKFISAKINWLEDFKKTQDGLREKLRLGDERILRNEVEVKENLEAIQRRFTQDRRLMKEELYKRVLNIAAILQTDLVRLIDPTIRRTMREETLLLQGFSTLTEELSQKKITLKLNSCKGFKRTIRDKSIDARFNHVCIKIQTDLTNALKRRLARIKEKASVEPEIPRLRFKSLEEANFKLQAVYYDLGKMKVSLDREFARLSNVESEKTRVERRVEMLREKICDARYLLAQETQLAGLSLDHESITRLANVLGLR